jgi:hypothetical protein
MASQLLASIGACTIVVSAFIWLRRSSASRILGTLPGPRSPSWVYGTSALVAWSAGKQIYPSSSGNMLQLLCADSYGDYEFRWQQQYGAVYRVKGCFGVSSSGLSPVTLDSLQCHIGRSPCRFRPRSVPKYYQQSVVRLSSRSPEDWECDND